MARNTFEDWVPEEFDSAVIQRVNATSAVEALGSHTPMSTATKSVPRSAGLSVAVVAKGAAYGEDESANDEVVLTARKFGTAIRVAEEDLNDTVADIIDTKGKDWAGSYGRALDNACLGTSAAANGTTVPFASVYYSLTQANADTGYSANANIVSTGVVLGSVTLTDTGDVVTTVAPHGLTVGDTFKVGTVTTTTGIVAGTTYYVRTVPSTTTLTLSATRGGATLALTTDGSAVNAVGKIDKVTYDGLSAALGKIESGDYFDVERVVAIAHPNFRGSLRAIKDDQGNPIFVQGLAGTPDTLFGHEIRWSSGARVHATASASPTGAPLMVFANRDFLLVGDRSGPESQMIPPEQSLTDEAILKYRSRRGFAVGHEAAFAVLAVTAI